MLITQKHGLSRLIASKKKGENFNVPFCLKVITSDFFKSKNKHPYPIHERRVFYMSKAKKCSRIKLLTIMKNLLKNYYLVIKKNKISIYPRVFFRIDIIDS